MSTLDFWDSAADGTYDEFVLGDGAPYEIRRLLAEEDRELMSVIEGYFAKGEDVVFVEIGSGTGRYMRLFGKLALTNELYGKHLKHIVGMDFSLRMIETSARALVGQASGRRNRELSLAAELEKTTDLPRETILEALTKRIHLLHADAGKPFLKVSDSKIVIGVMFGTLGNIPDAAGAISNVRSLVQDEGVLVVTAFNCESTNVGFKAYTELTKRGFSGLAPLRWDPVNSVFTSDLGFYSHWFSFNELRTLIEGQSGATADIVPLASQGMLARAVLCGAPKVPESRDTKLRTPTLSMLCPACGNPIGDLPVSGNEIACPVCVRDYPVLTVERFCVPSLFPRQPKGHSG